MEFGYPGANTHLENHGVSEESFWPSFTDIMMVIVMVFLLVTVAVILNNWSLIGDLKNSIQAQQIASNLAENRQQENTTLGSKLSSLEAKIIALNEKYEQEKASLAASKEELESNQQALSESQHTLSENKQQLADKVGSLLVLEEKVVTLNESLVAEKASLVASKEALKSNQQALSESQQALSKNKQQLADKVGSLLALEEKVVTLDESLVAEKASLVASKEALKSNQQALSENKQQLADKTGSLLALEEKLVTLDESLTAEKASHTEAQEKLTESEKKLTQQVNALTTLQTNFDIAFEKKNKLALLNKTQNSTIAENEKEQQALQQALNNSKSTIESLEKKQAINEKEVLKLTKADALKAKVLAGLQTDRSDLEKKVSLLHTDFRKAQKAAVAENALSKEIQKKSKELQAKFDDLKKSQQKQKDTLQAATDSGKLTENALQTAQNSLKELEEEKQKIIISMSTKLTDSEEKVTSLEASVIEIEKQVEEKDAKILTFNENNGDEKLRSLQGEYDTLDAKYQKLLRPARSSKGKYIVSVSYKKRSGKRIIRLKSVPDGSYKTVTKSELHKVLGELQKKHKTALYLKVIIPKTSGLSYNEAWKFTSNLQRKYDYYHQPDAKK